MAGGSLLILLSGACLLMLAGAKVDVDFYGEALCPYCKKFLAETAAPMFYEGFSPYMNFRYVAYGNAKNSSDGLKCQHGPEECRENKALLCAIRFAEEQTEWFPFALCLSENHTPEAVELCADTAKLEYSAIQKCMDGDLGNELVTSAAEETAALYPPHTYVPWVVVNGVAIGDAHPYLRWFVCAALGPGDKPAACEIPAVPPDTPSVVVRPQEA